MNLSSVNENGVLSGLLQPINNNMNDIYFCFKKIDLTWISASEVSRNCTVILIVYAGQVAFQLFKLSKLKLEKYQLLSIFVNKTGLEKQDINNVHNRQQRPQNNVKHKVFANIIDQIMKETKHWLIPLKKKWPL